MKARGFERFKPWFAGLDQQVPTFTPEGLFSGGEQGWLYESSPYTGTLYQDAAGTIPADADLDPVGLRQDASGNAVDQSTITSTERGLLRNIGGNWFLVFDLVDDTYDSTVPAIAAGSIAIFTSVGAWFDDFTSSAGAFEWGPNTYTGGPVSLFDALKEAANDYREIATVVIDRAFTAAEKASLISYYLARGCPGEITLGSELVDNAGGPFTTTTSWSALNSTLSVISNNLDIDTPGNGGAHTSITATTGDYIYLDYETVETSGDWRITTRENNISGSVTNIQFFDTGRTGIIFQGTTNDTEIYFQNTSGAAANCDLVRVSAKVLVFP